MDLRWVLIILTLASEMRSGLVKSVVYPSLQWSPQNPIFKENDTVQFVLPMSKIHIVCPNPSTVVALSEVSTPKAWLYENLWIVSKKAYEACDTTVDQGSRLLLKCMSPLYLAYYTLVFQQYSASIDGLEFKRDKEYYFIATSTGTSSSLDNVSGGNCKKNNMRLRFHVCKNSKDPRCNIKPSANQRPSSIFSEAPQPNRSTVRAVTSPLPTSRQPSTHRSRVRTHSTLTGGISRTSVVQSIGDTSESSVKLRREDKKPSVLGDVLSWKMMLLFALLLLSLVGNVILVHRLMRRKQETFVTQEKHKAYQQEKNQEQPQQTGSMQQEHSIDIDRTRLDRNVPILQETTNTQQHSLSLFVGLHKVFQRCRRKSSSSYDVQTVAL